MEPGSYLHQRRYRIRGQLGKGGMGTVYLAEDLNLAGRLVAIKENLSDDEDAQRQFRREAVLLAHLRHPNLPQVIDYFLESGDRQCLVMEYIPGENLHEVMRTRGPLPVAEAAACIEQIMQAVAYMHNQRDPETGHRRAIVHRDIKPPNIKRTPEGRYVLVDFGIAKQQSTTVQATAVSARALTPGYAPIEQYGGGTDERSDIYSLGATLYALLAGKTPPSSIDLAAGATLQPLRVANSKVPADMAKAVERAMKVNAGERFASVDELYLAITGRPVPTTPITNPAPLKPTSSRPNRSGAWLFALLAVISIAAIWWVFVSSETLPDAGAPVLSAAASDTPTQPPVTPTASRQPQSANAQDAEPEAGVWTAGTASQPTNATETSPAVTNTPLVSIAAASSASQTPLPVPTDTQAPSATPTHTNTPTVAPTPQHTSTPVSAPTPRPPTTASAPRQATIVPRSPTSGAPSGGPTSARIIHPGDRHSSDTPTLFKWVADAPLAPGQEFEIIFWRAVGGAEAQGRGILRSSTSTEVMQPVDKLTPDSYKWALILVQTSPSYQRIRRLAGPFELNVPGDWNPYRTPDRAGG